MILIAYRHGLRVSELVALKWSQIDLKQGVLNVIRLKNGISSSHPLFGPELRALRTLKRDYPELDYVFLSERKAPLTDSMFRKILASAGSKNLLCKMSQLFTVQEGPHLLKLLHKWSPELALGSMTSVYQKKRSSLPALF